MKGNTINGNEWMIGFRPTYSSIQIHSRAEGSSTSISLFSFLFYFPLAKTERSPEIKNKVDKSKNKSLWQRTGDEIATLGFSFGAPSLATFSPKRPTFAGSSAAADPSSSVLDAFQLK